jgi:hypothetical protein
MVIKKIVAYLLVHFYIQPIGHFIILSKKEKQLNLYLSNNPPHFVQNNPRMLVTKQKT